MPSRLSYVWLSLKRGLGSRTAAEVLDAFGSPEAVFAADRQALTAAPCELRKTHVDLLCDKDTSEAEQVIRSCTEKNIQIITIGDSAYPDRLRAIPDPPTVLYVRGRWPDFDSVPAVAVVGTRKATPYGLKVADQIGTTLARAGMITVSGMALGNDGAAHRGALKAGGLTVAVLAGGPDVCYPPQHRSLMGDILLMGAIISEYPPGTEPHGRNYHQRNRIISGLSVASVIVEASDWRSGALITARHALDQGRDVYAVPGPIDAPQSQSCNELIAKGEAALLTSPTVLVREYSGMMPEQAVQQAFRRQTGEYPEPDARSAWEDIRRREQQAEQRRAAAAEKAKAEPKQPSAAAKPLPDGLNEDEKTIVTLVRDGVSTPEELIDRCYRACDHLSLVVTLYSNGTINKEVVASVTESLKLSEDMLRLKDIFLAPSLQMISFTLTEKGYIIQDDTREFLPDYKHDRENGPEGCQSFFGKLTALCLDRCRAGLSPLALVSLDNCSDNGTRLERAVRHMARAWQRGGFITEDEYYFLLKKNTFPLSMIDKITPHPDNRIADKLAADGLENAKPFVTEKGTHAAVYVNSESPHYLLIENAFPNGHPALEQCGVIITRRDIVEKSARMKVSTCMNPMDTALGVFGCMLGYTRISDEMKDTELVNLITRLSEQEAMPMVADPGVIDPEAFLHEVLGERYPNPFLQDSPQRTATDTSRKIAPRFGTTLYAYYNSMLPAHRATRLIYIPLVLAGWLRYLEGVDDNGSEFTLSPDPNIEHVRTLMGNPKLGDDVSEAQLYPLLANRYYFGVNLFEIGVGETVVRMFGEMNRGPHAVR